MNTAVRYVRTLGGGAAVPRSAGEASEPHADKGVVADRLSALMAMKNPKTGKSYTVADVARDTGLSASAITQIKTGAKPNPTLKTVEAIADYFGVQTDFFTKRMDEERVRKAITALEMLDMLEDAGVQALFARANGLSDQSLEMIAGVIETARKADGLDGPGGR